jgi:hypothetical protein
LWALLAGALQGITVIALSLVAIFVVLTVAADLRKLRHRGRRGARSLDELVGEERLVRYLPPDVPRGPVDQLRTPELLELEERKSR